MTKLRLLTSADAILAAPDLVTEEVPTPEWGKDTGVIVQSMTAAQRLAYEQAGRVRVIDERGALIRYDVNEQWDNRVALVICSVVDEKGQPIFDMAQIEKLQAKSSAPLDRIADVARRLSRLRVEDAQEETARLKATPAGASPSGSA